MGGDTRRGGRGRGERGDGGFAQVLAALAKDISSVVKAVVPKAIEEPVIMGLPTPTPTPPPAIATDNGDDIAVCAQAPCPPGGRFGLTIGLDP